MDKLNKKMTKYAIYILGGIVILLIIIFGMLATMNQGIKTFNLQDKQTGQNVTDRLIKEGYTTLEEIEEHYKTNASQKSDMQNTCMNKTALKMIEDDTEAPNHDKYVKLIPLACEAVGYKLN